ncbi:sensor histidine kinase [Spirosoma linguale]|uniref:Signal transduction histidine kinase, LytS n=1 Tax=Spirosoma linguale (strain ATCC 33905 / DSM 74 / LMG 10896 / Claus 1) TaxID=504472 RepID=D2QJ78_SPILD|nr:signal transduction histidine kinase, LytS [Spirosoma linguale DSM 74]
MNHLNDKALRIIGPLALWAVGTVFFNLNVLVDAPVSRWRFVTFGIFTLYLSWFTIRTLVIQAQRQYPGLERTRQRIIWLAVLSLPATAGLVLVRLLLTIYYLFAGHTRPDLGDPLFMFGIGLFYATIIGAIYEARYFFWQWLVEKRASEELRRAKLEMQLNSLKGQVQPHFLFNSLNSLQALVKAQETDKAVRFIGDLAQVYRYLLQSNEQTLISLDDELTFTHAYLGLLKTRFDEGLQLEVAIDPAYRSYRLPPLTLQLLVENAVKHNIVSASRPLTIRLYSNGHQTLVVENNLQRRPRSDVASDKKGLLTISQKYRLLGQPDIDIQETEQAFMVTVPLIGC